MTTLHDMTRYDLPWESLEAIINGISSIDLTAMPIRDHEEAYQFILNYGYDMNRAEDAAEVRAFFVEAVNFINERLLSNNELWESLGEPSSPQSHIPDPVALCADIPDLLLMASQGKKPNCYWACTVLKVMHTLSHIQNGPYYRQFGEARMQILNRFDSLLEWHPGGYYLLKGINGMSVSLFGFEAKSQKTRESILVKMLCKKENVAENINDLIGVRFITHSPADAVQVIHILREQKVILFPNIIPSRSHNTLIDLERFRQEYEALRDDMKAGKTDAESLDALFRDFREVPENNFDHNPASLPDYRSIHITCRQLIRIPNPDTQEEVRFFIPYEVQVTDKESYFESRHGTSAHQMYKQKQFANARRRVLGPLLKSRKRSKSSP